MLNSKEGMSMPDLKVVFRLKFRKRKEREEEVIFI